MTGGGIDVLTGFDFKRILGIADALFDSADFLEESLTWTARVLTGEVTVEEYAGTVAEAVAAGMIEGGIEELPGPLAAQLALLNTAGFVIATALLFAATARDAGANASSLDDLAARHAAATFEEWIDLIAIPNVATVGADIQRNVAWLERAFQRRGFRTRQLANDDTPNACGKISTRSPSRTWIKGISAGLLPCRYAIRQRSTDDCPMISTSSRVRSSSKMMGSRRIAKSW